LNVHGGKQEYAVNYFETYAPVVTWYTVRLLIILSILLGWHTRQIDFVFAYPQADIEYDMYMELPKGIEMKYGNGKTQVLKLLKNLYGQKQAGRVLNQHLHQRLLELGFQQSTTDECLYYRGSLLFVVYVDDGILASKNKEEIEQAIKDI
jgi:Reverse transcriptase (RNA-dependent DNA polymerase)